MLIEVDTATLEILAQISQGFGGNRFDDYLAKEYEATLRRLVGSTDMADIHRAQGKAEFIDELRKRMAGARDALSRKSHRVPFVA